MLFLNAHHRQKEVVMWWNKSLPKIILCAIVLALVPIFFAGKALAQTAITIGIPIVSGWWGCTSEAVAIQVAEIQMERNMAADREYFNQNKLFCGSIPPIPLIPHEVFHPAALVSSAEETHAVSSETIEEALWRMMRWIAGNSKYLVPDKLPIIQYVSSASIMLMAHGEEMVARAAMPNSRIVLQPIAATYNTETGVISLEEGYDYTSLNGSSTLVHELVHHMQKEGGWFDKFPCSAQAEQDAYKIQNKWIDDKKTGEEHTDPMRIYMASKCPRER